MKIKRIFALTPVVFIFSVSAYASTLEHCPAIESIVPVSDGSLAMQGDRHHYTAPAVSQDCGPDRNQQCEWIGDTKAKIWEKHIIFKYAWYYPEPTDSGAITTSHGTLGQCTYGFTGGKYNEVSGEFSLKLLKPSKQDGSKTIKPNAKLEDLSHWEKVQGGFGQVEYECTGEGNPQLCTFMVE